MNYELSDQIRSSSVVTREDLHENVLAKKTAQKSSVRATFYVHVQNLVNKKVPYKVVPGLINDLQISSIKFNHPLADLRLGNTLQSCEI